MWVAFWAMGAAGLALVLWGVLSWQSGSDRPKTFWTMIVIGAVLMLPVLALLFAAR